MLQKTAHEVMRCFAEMRITVIIRKYRLTVLEKKHMNVHTAACLAVDRLGHKGSTFSVFESCIVYDILYHHCSIRHVNYFTKLRLDLKLTGSSYFGMMVIDVYTCFFHKQTHFTAALIRSIKRLGNVVVFLLCYNNAVSLIVRVPI